MPVVLSLQVLSCSDLFCLQSGPLLQSASHLMRLTRGYWSPSRPGTDTPLDNEQSTFYKITSKLVEIWK